MELDLLTEAIDRLTGSDPSACADAESIERLQRQLVRLDAFVTEATAAFDASGSWVSSGARNAASWLTTRCHMPRGQARRLVRRGRELRHLPACGRGWSNGDISSVQVDVIAALRTDTTEDALVRDESMLVEQARTLRYESFVRAAHYWQQLADPDGAEADDQSRRSRRHAYLSSSFGGMWLGKMTLDPISGSVVSEELERLERQLFESEWSAVRSELGRDPTSADLPRTPGQRRADALVEMATRSCMAPSDGRRPAPLFTVVIDYETLRGRVCELAQGTVLAPGALVPWLDQAYIERVVFAPARRIEVSASARLFSGATRRAIEVRDRECTHLYCDVPANRCEADHVVPFESGGPTTEENGRLLCGYHNRLRNQRPPPDG